MNGSNYTDPDAPELNTIENVIYLTMRNDISFLVDSQMTLYEQQSTYNPNMPLRGLMYFAQAYQIYLSKLGKILHRTSIVKIPNPRFIVFYNGSREVPDKVELKLSDAFEKQDTSGNFEWTATMININKNHNESLQKKCEPLYNYTSYVERISANKKRGMSGKDAVDEAMAWAIRENLLDGLFKLQKEEVLGMSLTEYDEEEAFRNFYEDGREAGLKQGTLEKAIEAAVVAVKNFNVTPQLAAEKMNAPLESVLEALK